MSNIKIQTIQNILKNCNRYDLALKLENCYFEDYMIDSCNGGIGEVNIFTHPNNFLFFKDKLSEDDKNLLIKIFDGLPHEYYEIQSIKFSIDTSISLENMREIMIKQYILDKDIMTKRRNVYHY